jgi:lysyl-tRNA synthetase class II
MAQEDLIQTREKKLERIKKALMNPYPLKAKRTHTISEAIGNFSKLSRKKLMIFGK